MGCLNIALRSLYFVSWKQTISLSVVKEQLLFSQYYHIIRAILSRDNKDHRECTTASLHMT